MMGQIVQFAAYVHLGAVVVLILVGLGQCIWSKHEKED